MVYEACHQSMLVHHHSASELTVLSYFRHGVVWACSYLSWRAAGFVGRGGALSRFCLQADRRCIRSCTRNEFQRNNITAFKKGLRILIVKSFSAAEWYLLLVACSASLKINLHLPARNKLALTRPTVSVTKAQFEPYSAVFRFDSYP